MIVIPAIDLKDGNCVRLCQGDFDRETRYSDDPLELAGRYRETGFDHLHVVDLDGALTGNQKHRTVVAEIAKATNFVLQIGGGIRSRDAIDMWLDAGAARCVIGSLAVTEPATVAGWLAEFGPERIVLALDVRIRNADQPMLATHGWTRPSDRSLWDCVESYTGAGLRHVLCTDIDLDGAMTGPNASLYETFIQRYPGIELQASGGVRDLADLQVLRALGCPAAITGRALLDGRITSGEIGQFLQSA